MNVVGAGALQQVLSRSLVFSSDFGEVLALVIVLFVGGHVALRLSIDWLIAASVFLCLVLSAANWLSFEIVGSLLSQENAALAVAWARRKPDIITQQGLGTIRGAAAMLLVFALVWSAAGFLFSRYGTRDAKLAAALRACLPLVALLQVACIASPRVAAT